MKYIVDKTILNGFVLKFKKNVDGKNYHSTDWFNPKTKVWIKNKLSTNILTCKKLFPKIETDVDVKLTDLAVFSVEPWEKILKDNLLHFHVHQQKSKNINDITQHTWDLSNQIKICDLAEDDRFKNFKYGARIVPEPTSKSGYKIEVIEKFANSTHLLYLLVIGGFVLKAGKSKNKLEVRSYHAGTAESWVNKGNPSTTNYIFSQIFRSCIEQDIDVQFYIYEVPKIALTYTTFDGKEAKTPIAPYEEEETRLNKVLKELNGGKNLIGVGKLLTVFKS